MTWLYGIAHAVPYSNAPAVKDVIASLHSYFTCNLLIGLAILLSYKQFGGRPIECMTPLGFNSAWNDYTEQYCYSSDTYYLPFNQVADTLGQEEKHGRRINYYQLMPFFLLFQAACFKFPTLIWKYFAGQSGIRVGEILRLATNESNSEPAMRTDNIQALCVHLQGALRFHSILKKRKLTPHKVLRPLNLKYSSHYVSLVYFVSKAAFFANVVCQIYLLSHYLLPDYKLGYGLSVWKDLLSGNTTWRESGLFPRVTLCDFEVREMGQTQNHTIQCVLILNIFTEKIFIILWAWYSILSTITVCNLISWVYILFNMCSAQHFILNHLEMSGEEVLSDSGPEGPYEIQLQVDRFITKYLHTDGVFILRMIAQHADVVFTTDLIYKLWQSHYSIEKQRKALKKSEKQWNQHLRRLELLEAKKRSIDGGWSSEEESAVDEGLGETKFIRHRDSSAMPQLKEDGDHRDATAANANASEITELYPSSHSSPSKATRRKSSLKFPKPQTRPSHKFRYRRELAAAELVLLRKVMSAETLSHQPTRGYKVSSGDEEDDNQRAGSPKTSDASLYKRRKSIPNEQKPFWYV